MLTLWKPPAAVLPVLLVSWQLAVAAPPAATRAKPAENPWAIILASKPQDPEVHALQSLLKDKNALQWLKPAEGFPKIVESASMPGLAPGLHVLVLGVCGSKESALAARARVLPMVEDAYVKQLAGAAPLSCPTPVPLKAQPAKGAVRIASVPFKQDKALALTVYKANESSVMECKTNDLLVRLEYKHEVIDELSLKGVCLGACTEAKKQKGEELLAEIRQRIANGTGSESELDYNFTECQALTSRYLGALRGFDRPLLFVSIEELRHHDVVSSVAGVVGVACGDIVAVPPAEQSSSMSMYDLESYADRAEARRKPPPADDMVEIGAMVKPHKAPDDAPLVWQKLAELQEFDCGWDLIPTP